MIIYMFEYLNTSLLKGISKMIRFIMDIHLWISMIFSLMDIQILFSLCRFLNVLNICVSGFPQLDIQLNTSRRFISMDIYTP